MSEHLFGDPPLAMTEAEALRLTMPQRKARLDDLIAEAKGLVAEAIAAHITDEGKAVAAVVVLFSGGNDSTVLAHLFRRQATHAAHAHTTIGIEETRDFVRNTCEEWGLPLLERKPPREQDHYRNLVLEQGFSKKGERLGGFPGPAMHFKMFARLKQRALEQIQRELVVDPHKERVVFIAGRRRQESSRRANIPDMERKGSRVFVSPLVNWTKADLNTYRLHYDVPVNRVSDLIHMSGECLCGAFASPGEREEVGYWFPEFLEEIAALEALLADRDDIPEHRKTWGWGADPALKSLDGPASQAGPLCSACDDRFQAALFPA
jgi:3'-phosphoadenosine 5'-phosphosulfate sulfotransferase (PAPS reductase)/FAD synthetase